MKIDVILNCSRYLGENEKELRMVAGKFYRSLRIE